MTARERSSRLAWWLWPTVAVALHVLQRVGIAIWPTAPGDALAPGSWSEWAGPWVQYDGWDYIRIADDGHGAGQTGTLAVWFPLYPLMIGALERIIDEAAVRAVLLALACGYGALLAVEAWCRRQVADPVVARRAVLLLALSPYAWFLFGGAYPTALFVLTAALCFLAWEHDRPVIAGLLGAAATATHPTGIALLAGLAVLEFDRVRLAPGPGDARACRPGLLLAFGGLAGYSLHLGLAYDDPLLWLTGRRAYEGSFLHDLSKVDFFSRLVTGSDPKRAMTTVVQFAIVVLVTWQIPAIARRLRRGYAVYTAVVVAIPVLLTADFNGCGRYLLAAFPALIPLSERLAVHPALLRGGLVGSAVLLGAFTVAYGHSWYLT